MSIYFIILFILLTLSLLHIEKNTVYFPIIWIVMFIFFTLFIGLRHEVGGDFNTYAKFFNQYLVHNFSFDFIVEPLFFIFYKSIGSLGFDIYVANTISAFLFMSSLSLILFKEKYPINGLFLSFPVLIVVVAMGFNRQSIAISFIIIGFLFWDKSYIKYAILVIVATFFHKSAIVMLLLTRKNVKISNLLPLIGIIFAFSSIYYFTAPHINNILKGYPLFNIQSKFSFLRVTYILIPSLLFLLFKRNFNNYKDYLFINKYVNLSLILIPIMILNVDIANRIGFYFLPLSIIILLRLPMIFNTVNARYSLTILIHIITIFYFTLFILYANHISGWVPYNNILIK